MTDSNKVSLYDRLGGIYAIAAVVDDFVERIKGDYDNVVGLPLAETMQMLESASS